MPKPPNTVCLQCHLSTSESVVLNCEHQICIQCAQKIKTLENGSNSISVKYKISCPFCGFNTTTMNISNLRSHEQQNYVFVNMESELSEGEFEKPQQQSVDENIKIRKLKEMSYNDRIAMIFTERQRRTPDILQLQKGNSIEPVSTARVRVSKSRLGHHQYHYEEEKQKRKKQQLGENEVECNVHPKHPLIFYCKEDNELLCMECMYRHMKQYKNHTVSSTKDALPIIEQHNQKYKVEVREKVKELDRELLTCKSNKLKLEQAYEFLDQVIKKQFKDLEELLRAKEKEVSSYLQKVFKSKEGTQSLKLQELTEARQILLDYYRYPVDTSQYSQLYFFNNFLEVKASYEESPNQYRVSEFKDEELLCFQRNATFKDFQSLADKLFVPKTDGRQSTNRSRAPSRSNIEKSKTDLKQIPEEAIKSVKKKMKQINKKIDSVPHKELSKNKRYQYLQNVALEDTLNQRKEKEKSLNHKKASNAWTPTPQSQLTNFNRKKK